MQGKVQLKVVRESPTKQMVSGVAARYTAVDSKANLDLVQATREHACGGGSNRMRLRVAGLLAADRRRAHAHYQT